MTPGSSNSSPSPELKALYGREYVERFRTGQSARRLGRLVGHIQLEPQDEVLDIGCGDALLLPYVASKVSHYVGVDFSEMFIQAAMERRDQLGIANAEFRCADIVDYCSSQPGRFDRAFAMDLAEHVPDEPWLAILQSVRMALRPGGVLYLHTPNARFVVEIMKARGILLSQFPEHVAVRSEAENTALLCKAGYDVKRVILLPHYNRLRLLHPLSYMPVLGDYFKARIFIEAVRPLATAEGGQPS